MCYPVVLNSWIRLPNNPPRRILGQAYRVNLIVNPKLAALHMITSCDGMTPIKTGRLITNRSSMIKKTQQNITFIITSISSSLNKPIKTEDKRGSKKLNIRFWGSNLIIVAKTNETGGIAKSTEAPRLLITLGTFG